MTLYADGTLSLEAAAKRAGVGREEFLAQLPRFGFDVREDAAVEAAERAAAD